MDWRIKNAVRHGLLALPRGAALYRWLTCELLGSNAGMAAKWFRVFPAHIRVLQENFGEGARQTSMWCFDSGATLGAGLAMAVATDRPGLMTDRRDRISNRYCQVSLCQLREKGPRLAELSRAPADRVAQLLSAASGVKAATALANIAMSYAPSHPAAEGSAWLGNIGCVFSAGTLEHYAPEELAGEISRMARILPPGGVMSHVVDHRDHRWHVDKNISPLLHLTLEEVEYRRNFNNPLDYHNRWLRGKYVELFSRLGFRVQCKDVARYEENLTPFDRSKLASPFRQASESDLQSLVTHFIAVRM
jgi:hypothetical protein